MLHTLRNRISLVKSYHLMRTALIRTGIGLWFMLGSLGLALICTYYYFNVLMATNVSICEISIFVSYTSLMCVSCFCLGLLICFSGFEKGFSCNRLLCYGISTISSLSSIQIGYFLLVLMLRNDISMIIAYSYIYILFNFPISIFSNIKFVLFKNAAEYFCVIWFMGQALSFILIILNLNNTEFYDYLSITPFVIVSIACIYYIYELPYKNKTSSDIIIIYSSITFLIGIIASFINMWNIFIISVQNLYASLILYHYKQIKPK